MEEILRFIYGLLAPTANSSNNLSKHPAGLHKLRSPDTYHPKRHIMQRRVLQAGTGTLEMMGTMGTVLPRRWMVAMSAGSRACGAMK